MKGPKTPRKGGPVAALALLTAGFALVDLPPLRAVFDAVALALAAAAGLLFQLGGLSVTRAGATLRESMAGWGMEVTSVCDGNGLAVAAVALVAALAGGRGLARAGALVLAGLAAIQIFNLLRILVLGLVLHLAPGRFEAVHLDLFPILTAALFLLAAGGLAGAHPARIGLALGLVLLFGLIWSFGLAALAARPLAGLANLILSIAPVGIGPLSPRPEGWLVESMVLAQAEPAILHRAAIAPADFAIALPLILAALLAAPSRAGALAGLAGLAVMGLALALGALTAVWAVLKAGPVLGLLVAQPGGSYALTAYAPPAEALVAVVRLAQNVLVHFNLLVLPGLILARAATRPAARPEAVA
jgi:exosortase/archaeosortase family protein